jgi:FkbM family methyltransferase
MAADLPRVACTRLPLRYRLQRLFGRQHWIRRGRDRVLRRLCNPDRAPALGFTVPFFGAVYAGRLDNFIDWSVFHFGAYARHELLLLGDVADALAQASGAAPAVFDVGANVGNHALFLAARGCPVFAFEPFAPVRERLLEKARLNPKLPIRVLAFGLADRDAVLSFTPPSGANVGTGSFGGDGAQTALALPVRRGDAAVAELGLPPVGILKIDVEGFEAEVLAGLRATIGRDRPVILFELSDRTRGAFKHEEGLRASLYPDHLLYEVGTRSVSGPYRLRPFQFASTSEVLALPAERLTLLASRVVGLRP